MKVPCVGDAEAAVRSVVPGDFDAEYSVAQTGKVVAESCALAALAAFAVTAEVEYFAANLE